MTIAAASPAAADRIRLSMSRIALAGLAGGAVDLVYASGVGALFGRGFQRVWQGVAGGWLGKPAFDMGWTSATLGLVTHFGIATAMAGAFALAGSRLAALYRRPWLSGCAYGLVLYGVMYGLVLPARWPQTFPKWDGARSVADILAHVGVGLAIAHVLRGRGRVAS